MPETEADIINTSKNALKKVSTEEAGQSLYIDEDLRLSLDGRDSFSDMMGIEGQVYRVGPGRKTLRFNQGGKDYFLKTHTGVGWREIFKNLLYLRMPVIGAKNEWLGIHRLNDLNVDTMTVAAYGTSGKNPAKQHSFIVTQALPTEVSLEDYCVKWKDHPPKTLQEVRLKRWLLNKIIYTARVMHESGMNHRDFYLCHFLLDAHFDSDAMVKTDSKLYVIDLHRIQLRKKTPERWLIKDIAGLYYSAMDIGLTKRDLLRFMKGYYQKPLRDILSGDMIFWNNVENKAKKLFKNERNKTMVAQNIDRDSDSGA